jgi:hypothetical protein
MVPIKINPVRGFMLMMIGKARAMPAEGPIPGSIPTKRPAKPPITKASKFCQVSTSDKI